MLVIIMSLNLSLGQAIKWIKNMESSRGLKIIDLQMSDYMRTLEQCVQHGFPVVLQNVQERLDPSLDSILNKAIIKIGKEVVYLHSISYFDRVSE